VRGASFFKNQTLAGTYVSLLMVVLCLAACGANSSGDTANARPTTVATTSTITGSVTPTQSSDVTPAQFLGVKRCPTAVSYPAYWDQIIPTQANTSKVESVTCANMLGNSSLQALVNVRFTGTGSILDVYVYDAITDPAPRQLFTLLQLYKGIARISPYSTLITAEVDRNSSVNKNTSSNAALQQDLFREFKWSAGAGTLVPVAFPGIFPDLTRYQAEADQQQVDQGHQPWKHEAQMTASALATTMLKWSPDAPTNVVSGGGAQDVNAIVTVKSTHPGSGNIQVTMSRLEGKARTGIWIISGVSANGLTITAPPPGDRLSNPTTVLGTGQAFEGVIGTLTILDHTYSDIGHTNVKGKEGMGNTTFSTDITYTSSFKTGTQEGVVVLYSHSNADGSIAGAAMVKVLL
jgi:Immunoglobulin-like domain of bacterial spore germination